MRKTHQRRQQILQLLLEHGTVHTSDLVERFGVSPVTIRSDLTRLEAQGLARRSHGGAAPVRHPPPEYDIHARDALNLPLKEAIAACAARHIKPGDNIVIDSGSTTVALARQLRGHRDITVMTNGLNIAWELTRAQGVELMLTGGVLDAQSLSLRGSLAASSLGGYGFDTLFLGVDGLDLQFGLSTHDEAEASLNHRMVERVRRVVVLTDASKFGRVALHRIAGLDEIDTVITDPGIGDEYREGLARLGIEVILADA